MKGVERRKVGANGKMLCVSRCKPQPLSNNLAVAQCVFLATGKAQKTEDRRQGRVQDRNSNTTCFACRAKGHAAKDCPNVLLAAANTDLGQEEVEEQPSGDSRGLKRKKGKKGADLAGSSGRCYRQVSKAPYCSFRF